MLELARARRLQHKMPNSNHIRDKLSRANSTHVSVKLPYSTHVSVSVLRTELCLSAVLCGVRFVPVEDVCVR